MAVLKGAGIIPEVREVMRDVLEKGGGDWVQGTGGGMVRCR